ncbi:MAG TPA: hypothetical protein VIJ62_12125 [Rhizomicrobium sp.]
MDLPAPVSGLVIRYSYLWQSEHERGQEEGVKDRPCAVILVTKQSDGDEIVTVLPITHTPPRNSAFAMEIPAPTKLRLGLDSERSWVVLTEANRFIWPGPDLRPVGGKLDSVAYGLLPQAFFIQLRDRFIAILKAGHAKAIARSD